VPDPDQVLDEVTEFVSLARDGAYVYGDRRVSRTGRSKWRLTFRSQATQAQSALHAADTGPAEQAMELLIDLSRAHRLAGPVPARTRGQARCRRRSA
jgi:hypothetical protein